MFVNHLCEAKGEQDGKADEAEESFGEFVIAGGDPSVALDFLEKVFYPMTTSIELCGEWHNCGVHADGSNPAGGQAPQALGRTKGGLNTKIHAVVNARSQAIVIALSSGNEADITLAEELTECLPEDSTLIGDKADDSSALRQTATAKGVKTCIPGREYYLQSTTPERAQARIESALFVACRGDTSAGNTGTQNSSGPGLWPIDSSPAASLC